MNIAVIVAGGVGSRVSSLNMPKQFAVVEGKTIMEHTLAVFANSKLIDKIVLVTNEHYLEETKQIVSKFSKEITIVKGGKTRQQSVYRALESLRCDDDDIVLIHDCARPLVTEDILQRSIDEAKLNGVAITAIKTKDSIASENKYEDRNRLYNIQTPQTFKFGLILKAHKKAQEKGIDNATDDGQLVKDLGHEIHLVEGNNNNFKITDELDLELFKVILQKKKS